MNNIAKGEQNSTLASQPEKPEHYTYLKEFRTQQCPLFLQHKCTQHRPYTCFNWHFANQRRRRPIRKRDGTFNYTPDSYCTKFDETSGTCANGDDCHLLHRNSGDTERRYHVRYYKTASCVHETDAKGVCTKNGAHCAFAHGTQDLRNPTYDIREVQAMERGEGVLESNPASVEMSTSMEKERTLNDDPKWNDSQYVLANYKTEPCKRPPRLCRQGYACPQYHNSKDRRRNPKAFKYRSTPCPQVKQHDEWGDPAVCDNGDGCQYCHTRTEQQFYPEIYKSTKCKDMVQTGYCPRGPFCAFAHVDQEINMTKDSQLESPRAQNSLASFISPTLQQLSSQTSPSTERSHSMTDNPSEDSSSNNGSSSNGGNVLHNNNNGGLLTIHKSPIRQHQQYQQQKSMNSPGYSDSSTMSSLVSDSQPSPRSSAAGPNKAMSSSISEMGGAVPCSVPEPIGKGRSQSMVEYHRSNSLQSRSSHNSAIGPYANSYTGSEFGRMRQHSGDLSNSNTSSLLLDSGIGGFTSAPNTFMSSNHQLNNMSPFATPFFPPGDTVESVIGSAMEDLNLGDFHHLSFADDNIDDRGDNASVCSSLSAGLASSYMSNSFSLPMSIPDRVQGGGYSLSQSPPLSPLGSLSMGISNSQNRPNRFSSLGSDLNPLISPRSASSLQPSAFLVGSTGQAPSNGSSSLFSNGLLSNGCSVNGGHDNVSRLKEELAMSRSKLIKWEEAMNQARGACEAWRKEADEATRKYIASEEERQNAVRQRDEALAQAAQLRQQVECMASNNLLSRFHQSPHDLPKIPINQLMAAKTQLRLELDQIQQLVDKRFAGSGECASCRAPVNITTAGRASAPCSHILLCENCSINQTHACPICRMSNSSNHFITSNGGDNSNSASRNGNKHVVLQSHLN